MPPRKEDALAGLERWKVRHPEAAAHLEPADDAGGCDARALHDLDRVRVNLIHVPEASSAAQEPLDPDYDPWAGFEWPDRSGQAERAPRKKPAATD